MTTVKNRAPLSKIPVGKVNNVAKKESNQTLEDDKLTVEEFLTQQCERIIAELQENGAGLIADLRRQYKEGAQMIKSQVDQSLASGGGHTCVSLKCISGRHIGQKYRLEPTTKNGEDSFKIGRSTGKAYREKGVSLYKDKEISTSHAKIEIKNGLVFFMDTGSTNGTQVNGGDQLEANIPLVLHEGDVIVMGSTELQVSITNSDDNENCAQL